MPEARSVGMGTHAHRTSIDSLFFIYGHEYTTEGFPCQALFFKICRIYPFPVMARQGTSSIPSTSSRQVASSQRSVSGSVSTSMVSSAGAVGS